MRWRWDFLNPLVLNGFRGFWHCHVPSRANGLLRADVEPATDSQAPVGAMWRVWSLASQIQGFPGSPGFQALQRVFDHCSTYPLGFTAALGTASGLRPTSVIDDLREVFKSVCADFEAELVEFDGEDDHVHLLVNYPPKVSVSALVNSLKGVSSRMIRKKNYPSIQNKLWGGALWSPSYFAGSCGGAPIAVIRQYIEQQQTPH